MAGNSVTLKKSGERRCSSRDRARLPLVLAPVVRVLGGPAGLIVPLLAAVSSPSFPEIFSKCPRITEVPRCSTSKYGKLWYGSTVKDSGAAAAVSGSAAAIRPAANLFDMLSSFCVGLMGIQPPACQASAHAIPATTSPRNDSSTACSQIGAPARSGRLAATGTKPSARTAYHGSCARIMVAAARSMVTTVAASKKVAPAWGFLPVIICTSRNAPDAAATAKPYKP